MTVHSLRTRALLVTPIRIVLGLVLVAAARLAGASNGPALLAFVVGALGVAFLAFNDPRARFAGRSAEPLDLPEDAVVAPPWRQALAATLPSTVGGSLLAIVALFARPVLAALLAGVCAGLGLASLISLGRIDPGLFAEPRSHVLYRRYG
jgi:hypothetical protein